MKRTSLRTRLVLWTVALEAVLLVVFAAVFVFVLRNAQNQQIDETLRLGAAQLNAVVDVREGQYAVAANETADLRSRNLMAWVLSPDGQTVLTIGSAAEFPLPIILPAEGYSLDTVLSEGTAVRLLRSPLTEGTRNLGTLILAIPLRDSQAVMRQILWGLAIAIPVVLALSAIGGLFLAGRALQPVADITHTAQQINAADLSQRLNLDLPDDEIGELAHTLNEMLARLDRAFQRERQLTADVSHELRTPLGMLKTQLSLARSRPREAPELLSMMNAMEGDVDRMTRLIEQMLTLARVEQRGLADFAPVALDSLLREVITQLRPNAVASQVNLQLEIPPKVDLTVPGDAERLRQVFTNLVENGLKYTSVGGKVTVAVSRHWQTITVTITDTGAGIAPEQLPHLFERFYRADDARARETGGFGLGLAISQAIVQAHGGTINVSSELKKGTTFTVSLPTG
ncbi:MAG: HAMP domain-containing protein [Anaerolineales bacterium]|nr:HAMP domain-containing protein [Anaerolineales bacterium]